MASEEHRLTLFHGDGTRSLRVRWVLEELGLPYDLNPVLFPPRLRQPEYLEENPLGSLPLLVDGDVRLTESMAICTYLAQTHGPTPLVIDPKAAGYAEYLQYCWYGEATLMAPLGALVMGVLMTPVANRRPEIIEPAQQLFARRLEPIARVLKNLDYLAGGRFTLADISVGYALGLAAAVGESAAFSHEVVAYRERLASRPAYIRATAQAATGEV